MSLLGSVSMLQCARRPLICPSHHPFIGFLPSFTSLSQNTMPQAGLYAVRVGRKPGIYGSWNDCEEQIKGYPSSIYKKFASLLEAQNFIDGVEIAIPSPSTAENLNKTKGKKRSVRELENESGWDVVYSDGACKGNGKLDSVAGLGVWWGHSDVRNIAERCPGEQTNNRAELIAILRVLETATLTKTPLLIKTDSKYSINCLEEWMQRWMKEDWKTSNGQPVKNMGIIRCISKNLEIRAKLGQIIRLQYVKGHSGEEGNDGADFLANQGVLMPPIPERDWMSLEKQLEERLSKLDTAAIPHKYLVVGPSSRRVSAEKVSPTRGGSQALEEIEPEPPAKRSRASHQSLQSMTTVTPKATKFRPNIPVTLNIQTSHSLGNQVLDVAPPIQAAAINPEDYADWLVDDDELAKELSD